MDIKYTILLVAAVNFVIGFLVLIKGKKDKANIVFVISALNLGFWATSMFFYVRPLFFDSLIWIKMVYFLILLLIGVWTYFVSIFPVPFKKRKTYLISYFVLILPLAYLLLFTDTWVVDVIQKSWGPDTILGPTYIYFGILCFIMIFLITYLCLRNIFNLTGSLKMQVIYVFLGIISFGILTTVFDVIIPLTTKNSSYFWVSTYFSLFFVGASAYAILKHHLMNVKVIATEMFSILVFLILLSLTLLSKSFNEFILNFSLFIIVSFFGVVLIRGALNEVKQKEELARINIQLDKANVDLKDLNEHLQEKVDEQTKEIKQAYEVEKKARIELQELDKAKDQFILIAQHHLRTPLTVIKGYLDVLKNLPSLPREATSAVDKIDNHADDLAKFINDLLQITEVEVNKQDKTIQK